jgi:hypothetical protein
MRFSLGSKLVTLLLAAALVAAGPLRGQTLKATILGTITDSSHAVIPGVQVSLTETNTNYHLATTTNDSGFYAFANLDPGAYRVEVEHPGFRKIVRAGIDLVPNTTVRVELELNPGEVTEVVNVTSEAVALQTDRSDTGAKIENQQISTLPLLNNRNYQNSLILVPGVQRSYRSNSPFFNSQEHLQSVVNGLDQKNSYMIEGIDNNIEGYMTAVVLPADAINSVDVSTTNYDPELGRAGGAVVNVMMKSGTNDFHGSLFEYNRVNALQARNVFANTVPHTVYNQYGGSIGGHIKRDKLFFFGDYQGSRDILGQIAIPTIPTTAMRGGDFSASPTIIYDPTTGAASGTGRTAFLNNQIPDNRISSIAKQYLSFLPPPTSSALNANYQGVNAQTKTVDQFDTKIDYVIGPNDRMFFRYSFQRAVVTNPGLYGPGLGIYGGPSNSGFDATGPSRNQSPGLNYSHIFGPTLVMEARFGIVRNRNDATNVDTGLNLSDKLGIPNGNLGDFWTSGLAEVFVNGYDTPMIGINGCLPWRRAVTNFDFANNWTKTKGTHLIKWGFDFRRERRDLLQTATFSPRGRFTFANGPTALNGGPANGQFNAFAAFLLDQPTGVGRDIATIFPSRRNSVYNAYVQDKWQITRKLTVDLGIRWEYWPADTPAFPGGFSNYIPQNNTLILAGLGNIPLNLGVENHPTEFGPRVGLAYRASDKTVVRAGFGISHFYRYTDVWQYPVRQNQSFNPPNSFVAAGSMAAGFPAPIPVQFPANGIITNPPNQNYSAQQTNVPQPYIESWNFAVQRSLPGNFTTEAAFVGNHGVKISSGSTNINASQFPGSGTAGEPLNILYGRTSSTTVGSYQSTFYEALQLKLNRRFSKGFSMTTSYAFGKSIDYMSDNNQLDMTRNKGLATWDRRHILTWSSIYELPFGQGKKWASSGPSKWLLGGWQANALWTWESGLPLDFTASATALNAPGLSNRPNVNGPVQIFGNTGTGQLYFDKSAFSNPPAPKFVGDLSAIGNAGRNVLHGPHLFSIDASIFRRFNLTERLKMEFRAETYNLSNTPWFDRPDTNFANASFGTVTTAQGTQSVKVNMNRSFQGSLRLQF